MTRNRLTDLAIADIKDAKSAELVKTSGGWYVRLSKGKNYRPLMLDDKSGRSITYRSKTDAKRALIRHNKKLSKNISIKAQFKLRSITRSK